MDKRKIDQAVYDRYIDASVALLTEVACQPLTEEIHRQLDELQAYGIPFPESLDKRCRETIQKERIARKRKKRRKILLKSLSGIACGLAVVVVLAGVLIKHVEAIRVPVTSYLMSNSGGYLQFTSDASNSSDERKLPKTVNWDDPLAGLITEDYFLTKLDRDELNYIMAIYKNPQGDRIHFGTSPAAGLARYDVDDPEKVWQVAIGDCEGTLIENEDSVILFWIREDLGYKFKILASDLTTEEALAIARQFQELLG